MIANIEYRETVSGVVHPVGPQPPKVYWRRRIIFLVLILLTLIVIGRSLFGGSDEPKAVAQASPSPTVSASPSESATSTPQATPSESIDPSTDPISQLTDTPAPYSDPSAPADSCADSDVAVSIKLDKSTTSVGSGLGLTMTVKNVSDTACKRNVGSGANEITIISGPALVWSTDHCSPGNESNYVDLNPGESWKVHVVWNGKLSAKGCQILSVAKYGAYWAHARNGALMSSGARFVVEN